MKCSKALATIDAQACTEQRCILPRNPREKRLLAQRCSAGALTRLYPGLYMHPQYLAQLNPFERKMHLVRALHLLHKQWVFAGSTAACIHDLQIPYMALGSKIHIASPSKPHHNDCAQLQRIHNPNAEWDFVNGVPVTSLTRTAVDGVNTMEDCCAITVLDSCLRAGVSEEDLLAACSLPNDNVNLLRAMLAIYDHCKRERRGGVHARCDNLPLGFRETSPTGGDRRPAHQTHISHRLLLGDRRRPHHCRRAGWRAEIHRPSHDARKIGERGHRRRTRTRGRFAPCRRGCDCTVHLQ